MKRLLVGCVMAIALVGCTNASGEVASENEAIYGEESVSEEVVIAEETIITDDSISDNMINGENEGKIDDLAEKEDETVELLMAGCPDNDYIDEQVKATVVIAGDEMIEDMGWVDDTDRCYRVSIRYITQPENAYSHVRDYFFFADEGTQPLIVTYSDGHNVDFDEERDVYDFCDFAAKFEDVNFDGNDDLIIFLGHQGSRGVMSSCAYIYNNGQYEYNYSFEQIPNYSLDYDNNLVLGFMTDSASTHRDMSYKYDADSKSFVLVDEQVVVFEN